jgi:hypothetical protein
MTRLIESPKVGSEVERVETDKGGGDGRGTACHLPPLEHADHDYTATCNSPRARGSVRRSSCCSSVRAPLAAQRQLVQVPHCRMSGAIVAAQVPRAHWGAARGPSGLGTWVTMLMVADVDIRSGLLPNPSRALAPQRRSEV